MLKFDMFDHFMDGVMFLDSTGLVVYANQAASNLVNISLARLIGKRKISEVFTLEPPIKNWNDLDFSKHQITNEFYQEFDYVTRSGISGSVNLVSKLVDTNEGVLQMLIMRDTSLEKTLHLKYQTELKEKNSALEREMEHSKELESLNTQLDRRIFQIECLFDFSQKTRLLSDGNHVLNELIEFTVAKFHFDCGFVLFQNLETKELDIQFINSPLGRKAIYSQMDLINEKLKALKIKDFNNKNIMIRRVENDWSEFLNALSLKNQNSVVIYKFKVNKTHQGYAVFSLQRGQRLPDDQDISLIQSLVDQTEVIIENTELKLLSLTDEMTKLYNLRYLNISLAHEIQKSTQSEIPLSLMIFDIDHFKKFNDTYGHLVGDIVIKAVAAKVKSLCRLTDIPFRYGGEEFILLLPNTPQQSALVVAERVRKGVEDLEVEHEGKKLKITISVGISSCPENAKDSENLIKTADEALYKAKHAGRNNCQLYIAPPPETIIK